MHSGEAEKKIDLSDVTDKPGTVPPVETPFDYFRRWEVVAERCDGNRIGVDCRDDLRASHLRADARPAGSAEKIHRSQSQHRLALYTLS